MALLTRSSSRTLGRRIIARLHHNLLFKILSLALAVGVWAWVQADEVVESRARVQVNYTWPEGLVNARQEPKTLVVTVSGPQGVVHTIKRDGLSIDVDLSEAEQGTVPVDFTGLGLSGLPTGVEVVQVSPPAIDIELDRALTRSVEVRPTIIGTPRDGWTIGDVDVEPSTARITGPQGRVKDIVQIPTDVIDVSGARATMQANVGLTVPDRVVGLDPEAPTTVHVTVHIDPVIVERTFESVPVSVQSPDAWTVSPSTARLVIRGPQNEVAAIRLDQIAVMLTPPKKLPSHRKTEITWRRGHDDNPVTVTYMVPSKDIELLNLDPRRFTLELPK